jgi:hypothetical protein
MVAMLSFSFRACYGEENGPVWRPLTQQSLDVLEPSC